MTEIIHHQSGEVTAQTVGEYIRQSASENSLKAFRADINHFVAWGGTIPSPPETIAEYLVAHADVLSIATLKRRFATLSKAHQMQGLPSPVQSEIVKMTLRGIQRVHGKPQSCASPLLKEDLISICGQIQATTKGIRDRALLLTGFCGAFRRSELVSLKTEDISFTQQGAIITLQRSKTDQIGEGRKIGIPYGRGRICPVKSLQAWMDMLDKKNRAVFRPVTKGGEIAEHALSGSAVSAIVKHYAKMIGLDPSEYSGHSLRSGLATSAAMHGVSSWKIRQQTGHKSDTMLSRYIRSGDLFVDNAAGSLF